jgi:putative transposase
VKNRFTAQQILFALRQASTGTPIAEITRRKRVNEPTFYRWKKQIAGLESQEVRQLKQLEDENNRLKQLVADLTLDKQMLHDVLSKKL